MVGRSATQRLSPLLGHQVKGTFHERSHGQLQIAHGHEVEGLRQGDERRGGRRLGHCPQGGSSASSTTPAAG
jgi:hypothetical protein